MAAVLLNNSVIMPGSTPLSGKAQPVINSLFGASHSQLGAALQALPLLAFQPCHSLELLPACQGNSLSVFPIGLACDCHTTKPLSVRTEACRAVHALLKDSLPTQHATAQLRTGLSGGAITSTLSHIGLSGEEQRDLFKNIIGFAMRAPDGDIGHLNEILGVRKPKHYLRMA